MGLALFNFLFLIGSAVLVYTFVYKVIKGMKQRRDLPETEKTI